MKFFIAIVFVALVAFASAEDATQKLEQVQGLEPVVNNGIGQPDIERIKRAYYQRYSTQNFVPSYTASYRSPSVSYSAGVPYAYSGYSGYSPYSYYSSYPSYYF